MEIFVLIGLLLVAIPFVLPIAAWVSARRSRARLEALEKTVELQQAQLEALRTRLATARVDPADPARPVTPAAAAPPVTTAAPIVAPVPLVASSPTSMPPVAVTSPAIPPVASRLPVAPLPASPPPVTPPAAAQTPAEPRATGTIPPVPPRPVAPPPASPPPPPRAAQPPPPSPPPPPRRPAEPEPAPGPGFDWESLIGVKLFAAIAGVALVIAAVIFLKVLDRARLAAAAGPRRHRRARRHRAARRVRAEGGARVSGDRERDRRGGDRDPVRDLLRGARAVEPDPGAGDVRPARPWSRPLAVLLSIRRESLFIAVLGLLGGFATPVLLSTGENRPIPLFAYLLLLNVGLAWVAYSRGWPVLTWLTLGFTILYQWGWVFKFLDASSCRWRSASSWSSRSRRCRACCSGRRDASRAGLAAAASSRRRSSRRRCR